MGVREQKKQQTRDQLIETSLELFRERGFDQTRVQDIVEVVGVSPATFFNYFPSKESVLETKADETTRLYSALLRHELDRDDATVPARLEQITRVLAEFFQTDAEISRLMVTRTRLFFGATDEQADDDRRSHELLADLFARGQERGEIAASADTLQLAEMYTALFTVTTWNWLENWWGRPQPPLTDLLVQALEVFLYGAATRQT